MKDNITIKSQQTSLYGLERIGTIESSQDYTSILGYLNVLPLYHEDFFPFNMPIS